jgi:hypothetical protein
LHQRLPILVGLLLLSGGPINKAKGKKETEGEEERAFGLG